MTKAYIPQRGGALLILLCALAASLAAVMAAKAATTHASRHRDAVTARALAHAHGALLSYAVAVAPNTAAKRPGDLPCPDLDNDGSAELTCVAAAMRIGRLPWRTLDLPDLRDGDGERLWYALSGRFDRTTSNQCPVSGGANCLNSDTPGTLTVRDTSGATLHDGSDLASGAIAVVIAPGRPLQRVGVAAVQARNCTGDVDPAGCELTGKCSSTVTALCDPANYLDRMAAPVLAVAAAAGGAEDNAGFADGDTSDGFMQGPIRDNTGATRLNDRLRMVRREDLMPALERRVAAHAARCLETYAADSSERMPWASPLSVPYTEVLTDQDGVRFGRLPTELSATAAYPGMQPLWSADCPSSLSGSHHLWWANWKDQVFYAMAEAYAPNASVTGCGSCLTVDPPSPVADKRAVVLIAGAALPGQFRDTSASAAAYLEAANADGDDAFGQALATPTFNDRVWHP